LRFFVNGPSLPDELLTARDEGRVLFFCGAGVSRENAHLPDFFGLARAVLAKLRALPDSRASKLVEASQNLGAISGVGSVIAADRIFGLLEQDFPVPNIERAVGDILRPAADVNLRAHQILLDLCRNTDGKVRLVTTNFDRLFEAAAPKAVVWTPSRLPQLSEIASFDGIVHLHGIFDHAYQAPVGGSFILSSAEFGRAYLSEGWANGFIRNVIYNYRIVFVGYAGGQTRSRWVSMRFNRGARMKHERCGHKRASLRSPTIRPMDMRRFGTRSAHGLSGRGALQSGSVNFCGEVRRDPRYSARMSAGKSFILL
jgi:hypothetical protein